ncbi:uncharacterized protein LOC129752406 [Uranotaenia lowii]|uniref:uncharacterized protein LOC129752406 n=1 Tax=Uranotaenia lowii TaxID=190385 RepID=UPI0024790FBD|nr:uncharacterized protein LOC129752406 [Uranotaenia lowii]
MKGVLQAILLIGLHQLANNQANGNRHSITLKTAVRVHKDCRKILQIPMEAPEGECEDRCEIIIARAWDDIRGPALNMLRAFWHPQDPQDECYIDRTYRCFLWNRDRFNLTSPELCRRAQEMSLCFDYYYGRKE